MQSSRPPRHTGTLVQAELFHNALMASRYTLPTSTKSARTPTPEPLVESGFSEIALNGAPSQCLQWLAPVLRDLSQAQAPGWLTLLDPPAAVSHLWLRNAGLDPERILIVRSKSGMNGLELCCELLRLGCSHTVVSWMSDVSQAGITSNLLTRAARDGHCRSLNIRLDTCLAA
ncbi:SOS-induced cell division inhibitor SulA [Halopseudomonas pelagia]|uniref:SOS-induced cell division inhibitor SulA n=1 Tax=Halopseudomonas pelagia TaxID=553151 RepID=UPI0003B58D4E|nr:SOS-induced cell division inhibitor SulA [Halopseudomonas pelagia]|tara:strand:- start:1910 stop:2428 length:519 start_codon:yes stop_codon:yes gene_type:complete